jgi:hypothetical protein
MKYGVLGVGPSVVSGLISTVDITVIVELLTEEEST